MIGYVYELLDEDGEPAYVGSTCFPTRRRAHWKRRRPYYTFRIIERVDVNELKAREQFWIDLYLNTGCVLLNNRNPGGGTRARRAAKKREARAKAFAEGKTPTPHVDHDAIMSEAMPRWNELREAALKRMGY